MALWLSAALAAMFAVNVALASSGRAPFLGDVGEMLTLLAATVAFVAAILQREARARLVAETDQGRKDQ